MRSFKRNETNSLRLPDSLNDRSLVPVIVNVGLDLNRHGL